MVCNNMTICGPTAGRHFLCGMIVGVICGLLLLKCLNTSYNLSLNSSNPKRSYHLIVDLYDEVKVLCWIMTGPKTHKSRAQHVKTTWGKRCNILLFMSSENDSSLPSIALPVIEDRDNLWGKTKEAFKYVYKHYYDKADWFFKADDDTYAIMENMRYMLRDKNTSDPVYYGFRFKPLVQPEGYMSGGAGYVLSKEALRRFINESLPYPKKCKQSNIGNEDVEMGFCLRSVKVIAGDSRDRQGKIKFMPLFSPSLFGPEPLGLGQSHWLWNHTYYPIKAGMKCCSNDIITFHYISAHAMYLLEYLIYHVKPFGVPYDTTEDDNDTSIDTTTKIVSVKKRKTTKIMATSTTNRNNASWGDYY